LWLAVVCSVCIFAGSIISTNIPPELPFKIGDKIIHSISYFILSCLWFLGIFNRIPFDIKKMLLITLLILLYGIIIEVLQEVFTQYREADFFDILANFVGVFIAATLVLIFRKNIFVIKAKNKL